VLGAYRTAPEVTRERLHIEALEGILDQVELILLDEDAVGSQVLPFLPLTDASDPEARPSAPAPGPAPSPAPSPAPDDSDSTGEGE
jgi:membrane protease subunit HflK